MYLEDFPAMPFVFAARHSRILMMQKHSENINAVMRNTDKICDFVFMENNFKMFQDHVLMKYKKYFNLLRKKICLAIGCVSQVYFLTSKKFPEIQIPNTRESCLPAGGSRGR